MVQSIESLKPTWQSPKGLGGVCHQGGWFNIHFVTAAVQWLSPKYQHRPPLIFSNCAFGVCVTIILQPTISRKTKTKNIVNFERKLLIVPKDLMRFSPVPIWSYQFAVKCRFIFCKYSQLPFRTD